jgi:hypothetical protein
MDFLAIEALISDLHPCPKCADCRKIFHYETNGLSSSGKTPIAEPLQAQKSSKFQLEKFPT